MRIVSLELQRFRNYENLQLNDLNSLVIFCGPNAVGKTNILEALHLLSTTTSFRHPQINQMIQQGCDNARIQMDMTDGNRQITTALALEAGKKRFTVNGKAKSSAEVKGILPAVSFIPDDLEIAKKSSSLRSSCSSFRLESAHKVLLPSCSGASKRDSSLIPPTKSFATPLLQATHSTWLSTTAIRWKWIPILIIACPTKASRIRRAQGAAGCSRD